MKLHPLRQRRIAAALAGLLAGVLAGCEGTIYDAHRVGVPSDQSEDPFEYHKTTQIERVVRNPDAFKNQPIEFELIYNDYGIDSIWVPFRTKFTPEHFMSFSGWSPRAPIWDVDVYAAPVRTLYLRRDQKGLDVLDWPATKRFVLLHVEGIVQSTFDGIPWIEVTRVATRAGPQFTGESLGALMRALDLSAEGSPAAVEALERVLTMPLSRAAKLHVRLVLGATYAGAADAKNAVLHYDAALKLCEDDLQKESVRSSLEAARKLLERQNAAQQLKEATPEPAPAPNP
jgi:hypothetical protein